MNIGLITYHNSHLKTLQLTKGFLKKNYKVTLIAYPFHFKKKVKKYFIKIDQVNY